MCVCRREQLTRIIMEGHGTTVVGILCTFFNLPHYEIWQQPHVWEIHDEVLSILDELKNRKAVQELSFPQGITYYNPMVFKIKEE